MGPTPPTDPTRQQTDGADRWVLLSMLVGGVLLTLAHRLSADEGQILTGAWNLYNGRRIYEDFFEFIGPASFAWVELFFRAIAPTYSVALIASQLLLLLSLWAFHATARLVIPGRPARIAASLIWLLLATTPPFINHNSYGSFLGTLLTFLLLSGDSRGARWRWTAFAAGVTAGLTFFFLQPKGGMLLAASILALALPEGVERRWPTGQVVTGGSELHRAGLRLLRFGMGAALAGLWGLWLWGLNPVTSILTVARGNVAMNHLTLSYWPLAAALSVAALVGVASYREGLWDRSTVVLLLVQGALWGATLHLPDSWHLAINAFPLVLLLGRLAAFSLDRLRARAWRWTLAGLFFVVVLLGVGRSVSRNVSDTVAAREWLDEMEAIVDGHEFYAFTLLPSFYLELQTPNPFYNSVLYTGSHPAEHFERNRAILARRRTPFVIADYALVERYGHDPANPVDIYLRREYRLIRSIRHGQGVLEVWERGDR